MAASSSSSSSIISTKNQRRHKHNHNHNHKQKECCHPKNDNITHNDYYPDILSLTTETTPSSVTLTYDFAIRSLRRRLWKSFCDDDCITALRAYQATLSDFICWLDEEDELRRRKMVELAAVTAAEEEEKAAAVVADAVAVAAKEEKQNSQKHKSRQSLSSLFSSSNRRSSSKLLDNNNDNDKKKKKKDRKSKKISMVDDGNNDDDDDYELALQRRRQQQRQEELEQQQKKQQQQQTESVKNIKSIEKLLGGTNVPILQSQMNPSDFFIADDFLSPYDYCTYDKRRKIQKVLPTAHQQHQQSILFVEEERQRRRIRQRRLSIRQPRVAFRRIFSSQARRQGNNENNDEDFSDAGFGLVNSSVSDGLNEHDNNNNNNNNTISPSSSTELKNNNKNDNDNIYMTTPLHEAARLGFGDFVRFLLSNEVGADVNEKNGYIRTAVHMCAGGFTVEEERLINAQKQKDDDKTKNIGISTLSSSSNSNSNSSSNSNSNNDTKQDKKRKKERKKNKSSLSKSSSSGVVAVEEIIDDGTTMTPLSSAVGTTVGITASSSVIVEDSLTTITTIGIRATLIPKELLELLRQDPATATTTKTINDDRSTISSRGSMTKRGSLIGRILFNRNTKGKDKNDTTTEEMEESNHRTTVKTKIKPNPKRLNAIVTDRMDAMMALLSWIQKDSCQGPSINAVDNNGRTALHYAAEMGRTDICMAILSNFGVILTVVDESSRTPCEVASLQGHSSLAAQLEARALLYIDPYGLDDDMMDNMMAVSSSSGNNGSNNNNKKLVPPFRWFQTMSMNEVAQNRMTWLLEVRRKLISISNDSDDINNNVEDIKPSSVSKSNNKSSNTTLSDNLVPYTGTSFKSNKKATDQNHRHSETEVCRHDIIPPAAADLERFMAYHKWDRSAAIEAFRKDPKGALATAGVRFIKRDNNNNNVEADDTDEEEESRLCTICYDDDVDKEEWTQFHSSCNHGFCKDCLLDYVKQCATNRTPMHLITCPSHDCDQGLSFLDVQSLLIEKDHTDTFERIKEASTESFITSSSNYKYCPHPGCEGVVYRLDQPEWTKAGFDKTFLNYTGAVCTVIRDRDKIGDDCTLTYEGVEDLDYNNCRSARRPPKAHRFCFSCLEPVHWPLTCERMKEWKEKITEEIGEIDDGGGNSDFNELAQNMWLKANTRPCPHCKAPIEKNDGCNHVVCKSCTYEFCWVCMKAWYLHTIETTDGYFRCSIWEKDDSGKERDNLTASLNDNEGYGTSIYTARQAWRKKQEMKRFLHHYSKYTAHEESSILEQNMGDSVCTRLAPVVEAAIDFDGSPLFNFGGNGLSFVHNAFFELLECRSILRHSYAFSYFRYPSSSSKEVPSVFGYLHNSKRKEKARFERTQLELEMLTEQMSDIVGRSHIRATQMQIKYLTVGAAEKRVDFTNFMFQIYREEKKEIDKQNKRQAEEGKKNHVSLSDSELAAMDNVRALRREHDNILNAFSERIQRANQGIPGAQGLLGILDGGGGDDDDDDDDYHNANGPAQMWACSRCTFMNTGGNRCSVCASLR